MKLGICFFFKHIQIKYKKKKNIISVYKMSRFTLNNINEVKFRPNNGNDNVTMSHVTGGVSVDGYIVATGGVSAGTLRLTGGSITDTSAAISFGGENLSTTGTLGCGVLTAATGSAIGNLTLADGSITDSSNAIFFGGTSLSNTGGVSFKGEVSLNGYTYPTSLGTSQFLYHKSDTVGVSGYGLIEGTNITLTYGETGVTIASSGGGGGGGGGTSINGLTDAYADSTNVVLGNEPSVAITGTGNTGIGVCALYDLSGNAGVDNTAVGQQALQNITSGNRNIAIGSTALEANITSSDNIAIGYNTLYQYSGTENNNTVVGSNSGSGITSSGVSGLTIIGASSGVGLTSASSNLTLIGHQVETVGTDISNTVYLGNAQVTTVYMQGNVMVTSDGRDKTDVEDSSYGLNIVDNLRPVEFTWDRRPILPGDAENTTNGQRTVGLIAQEVRDSLTEEENKILNLVNDSSEERFHMCYNNLIPILVKAVKDLKAEVDTLKQRMDKCSC